MENSEIVCECLDINVETIKDAINSGCATLECIESKTEAGSACQRCKSLADDRSLSRKYHILEDFLQ